VRDEIDACTAGPALALSGRNRPTSSRARRDGSRSIGPLSSSTGRDLAATTASHPVSMPPLGLVRCDVAAVTDVSAQFGFNTCINCPERCAEYHARFWCACTSCLRVRASRPANHGHNRAHELTRGTSKMSAHPGSLPPRAGARSWGLSRSEAVDHGENYAGLQVAEKCS